MLYKLTSFFKDAGRAGFQIGVAWLKERGQVLSTLVGFLWNDLPLSCTLCHWYCCCYCSFYLIVVSSKLFLTQLVIFAFCAFSWRGEGERCMVLVGALNWKIAFLNHDGFMVLFLLMDWNMNHCIFFLRTIQNTADLTRCIHTLKAWTRTWWSRLVEEFFQLITKYDLVNLIRNHWV